MKKRLNRRCYGMVQGVGFRYRAYYAAKALGIGGYVQNLMDGSVFLVMEGEQRDIDMALSQIEQGHFVQIDRIESREEPLQGQREFLIKD